MIAEQDAHSWSGWPGAYCIKCHCDDPMEEALADGLIFLISTPDSENGEFIWCSNGALDYIKELSICPVKGIPNWDSENKKFVLVG